MLFSIPDFVLMLWLSQGRAHSVSRVAAVPVLFYGQRLFNHKSPLFT